MSINEICTQLKLFAYQCGDNHYTPQEIQERLLNISEELNTTAEAIMREVDHIRNIERLRGERLRNERDKEFSDQLEPLKKRIEEIKRRHLNK